MLYSTIVRAGQRNKMVQTISAKLGAIFWGTKASIEPIKKGLDRGLNPYLHGGSGGRIRTTDLRVIRTKELNYFFLPNRTEVPV